MFLLCELLVFLATRMSDSIATKLPPNIILILADDMGWDDVSFHGSDQIPTPNIDSLAADGIILNNYYALPACTPSRAALLTGLYPIHTGMQQSVILPAEPWGLPLEVNLMPQFFRELGYETHLVGKWHLGSFAVEYTPVYRGFDTFYGFYGGEVDYRSYTATMYNKTGLDLWDGTEPLRNQSGRYSTNLFTERAIHVIQSRNKTKHFFLFLSQQAPHAGSDIPLDAPAENIAKFSHIGERNRTIYAGMMDTLDQSVASVVQTLYQEGMLQNSIIVFMSDNGGLPFGPHSNRGFNWPLRGAKGSVWEGACRVPAFIWSPLLKMRGRVSQQMMHIVDWVPTLYAAAGGDSKLLQGQMDGKDMWRALSLNLPSPRAEFLYNIEPEDGIAAVRYRNYKLVLGVHYDGEYDGRYRTPEGSTSRYALDHLMANSKVTHVLRRFYRVPFVNFPYRWRQRASVYCGCNATLSSNFVGGKPPYLFDLARDPCELKNLASKNGKMVAALMGRLNAYFASSLKPRNRPIDPRGFPEQLNGTWGPWL
ncbi:arylsulfatase B-like [Haemaphysalis longicornis]